jgi:hypothetical protein
MRGISLIFLICLTLALQPARATTIDPSQVAGAVPGSAGTGLNGSYYKFNSSVGSVGSLSQANQLISSAGVATATFTTTTVCFPDCAGTSISDSSTLSNLLNGNVSNFSYTSPAAQAATTSIDHAALVVSGYIAISVPGSYTFYLGSDDGSQLVIGGQTIVNDDGLHAFSISSGTATFSVAGLYAISGEYFENSGVHGHVLFVGDLDGAGTGVAGPVRGRSGPPGIGRPQARPRSRLTGIGMENRD